MWPKRNYIALLYASFSLWIISTQVYSENLDDSETQDTDNCGPPPSLEYGEVENTYLGGRFVINDMVSYKCREGYARVDGTERFITCMDTLQWSEPTKFCTRACKPPPSALEYANLRKDFLGEPSFHVGAKVDYECKPGYTYVKLTQMNIQCLENFTWSDPEVFCTRIPTCEYPLRLQYAEPKEEFLDKSIFAVGDKVTFQCRPGFISIRPFRKNFLICQPNLEWSTIDIFCEPRSCGYPGEISNGELEYVDFLFGSRVTYKCDTGYTMITKRNFRECLANGQWSNTVPECEAMLCIPPDTITNGNYNPEKDEYQYLDAVTYSCSRTFDLIGESSIYCTKHGNWSSEVPECKVIRCPAPNVRNAQQISGFSYSYSLNTIARFQCFRGFQMKGSATIKCNSNSLWEPEPPKCLGVCQVESLNLRYATVDEEFYEQRTIFEGSKLRYHCVEGFEPELNRENTVECLGKDRWSYYELCHRKSCGDPGHIENGNRTVTNNFLFESSIIYACKKGFKMISDSKLYCQADGMWNMDPPTCEVIICAAPNISDGKYSPEKVKYFSDDLLTFSCDGNLKLVGDRSLTCVSPGIWNSSIPQCQEVCDSPPVIQYAVLESDYIHQNFFNVSETVQYECKPGYTRIDNTSNTITCSVNLTWSSHETFCQRVSCGKPEEILHGDVKAKDFLFESKAYYTCDPGYKMASNTDKTECQANGKWSKPIPECRVQICPTPPPVAQGSYHPQKPSYKYLDSITYTCNNDLNLFGTSFQNCTKYGKWSSFAPQCKESLCDKIWATQEEMRKCSSAPDDWIKYLQVEYLYLQIENLKLDLEKKKKERR